MKIATIESRELAKFMNPHHALPGGERGIELLNFPAYGRLHGLLARCDEDQATCASRKEFHPGGDTGKFHDRVAARRVRLQLE